MKNNIVKKLKQNRAITALDASVAIVIIMIFVSLVASLFINIYNITKKTERKATALNIAIQAVEGAKLIGYDNVQEGITYADVLGLSGNSINASNLPSGYDVDITVIEQETYKEIIVNVSYIQNKGEESIKLKTVIYPEKDGTVMISINAEVTNSVLSGASFEEGDTIQYEISVSNIGNAPLYNVQILEGVDIPYGENTWDIADTLEAGEETDTVSDNFTAENGTWYSYIKVIATTEENGGDQVEYTTRLLLCNISKSEDISVKLVDKDGPANGEYYELGEEIELTAIIKNTGRTAIRGISIESAKGTETNIIERLEAGESKEISGYTYIVQEDDIGNDYVSYSITVTASEPELKETATVEIKVADEQTNIEIVLAETSSPSSGSTYNYYKDSSIDFKITITNSGNAIQNNISLRIYIGTAEDMVNGVYDYSYGWTEDFGLSDTKTTTKSIAVSDIDVKYFTGDKIVIIEATTDEGTITYSNLIQVSLSNSY